MKHSEFMKVALVYDRLNKWGGAERVLLALHELFPDAPLYTSVYNPKKASWAKKISVRTSFLQQFPYAPRVHEFYALLMPMAFESFSFDEFDLVISVTSEAAKGIITKPQTKHLCYCLTPTRYLWSGYEEYFSNSTLRFFAEPAVSYLRRWDTLASSRPDVFISISKEVQSRVKKYYGRESEVIYPPVALPGTKAQRYKGAEQAGDFFLVVSRLVPYKRIDLAIQACNMLEVPLKIVGSGVEEERLKRMAGPTVQFLGSLTDDELVGYYKQCKAVIFPGREDFGITAVEAMSFGKPVIAFKGGGVTETVIEGKTGTFFYPQTADALLKKIQDFDTLQANLHSLRAQAKKFSKEHFKRELLMLVNSVMTSDLTLPSPKRRGIKGI